MSTLAPDPQGNDGLRGYLRDFFCPRKAPDFEQIVRVVMSTFTVFTGFVFSGYLKDEFVLSDGEGWFGWLDPEKWRLWGFFALMALLLRYIMGSGVHLNFMYVPVKPATEPRSQSSVLLFKDLVFLVAFGVIAMSIVNAAKFDQKEDMIQDGLRVTAFLHRAMLFVAAGFVWSVVDAILRGLWSLFPNQQRESPGYFWIIWATLDAAQFVATWLIIRWATGPLQMMVIAAVVYVGFLFLDVAAVVRGVQATRPVRP
jgi:hypothetical protein